jgi:hypothetical protein
MADTFCAVCIVARADQAQAARQAIAGLPKRAAPHVGASVPKVLPTVALSQSGEDPPSHFLCTRFDTVEAVEAYQQALVGTPVSIYRSGFTFTRVIHPADMASKLAEHEAATLAKLGLRRIERAAGTSAIHWLSDWLGGAEHPQFYTVCITSAAADVDRARPLCLDWVRDRLDPNTKQTGADMLPTALDSGDRLCAMQLRLEDFKHMQAFILARKVPVTAELVGPQPDGHQHKLANRNSWLAAKGRKVAS